MRFIYFSLYMMVLLLPQNIYAQNNRQSVDASYGAVVMPELFSESVLVDNDEVQPTEPNISKVSFLKLPETNGNAERVDRLIQGIKNDIPPEYDYYGHEIRRYMSGVGNAKIFTDDEYLIEQIKNTKKARVIATYWEKHIDNELKELSEIISKGENIPFPVRSAFKQNKVTAKTFLVILKGWIDTNKNVLEGILATPSNTYELLYPEILFENQKDGVALYNNIKARQVRLNEIRRFHSFAMMVY